MRTKLLWLGILSGCAAGGEEVVGSGDLIDDLEDGDDVIDDGGGRVGGWYTFHDDTAGGTQTPGEDSFTPSEGGAGDSAYAAATSGSGFADWGAGMGFDLNNPEAIGETGARGPYDASGYGLLVFQARGNTKIRLSLETVGVTPSDRGGDCTPSTTEGMECEDLHGKTINLGDDWQEYQVPFAELRQEGWGLPVDFDPARVTAVLFQADKDVAFDFAVDDVRFYE